MYCPRTYSSASSPRACVKNRLSSIAALRASLCGRCLVPPTLRHSPMTRTRPAALGRPCAVGPTRQCSVRLGAARAWSRARPRARRWPRGTRAYPFDRRGSDRPTVFCSRMRPWRFLIASSPPPASSSCRRAAATASRCVANARPSPVTSQPPPGLGPTVVRGIRHLLERSGLHRHHGALLATGLPRRSQTTVHLPCDRFANR